MSYIGKWWAFYPPIFTYSNEFTIKEKEADTSKIGTYLVYLMGIRGLQEQYHVDIEFSHELLGEESKEVENIFRQVFPSKEIIKVRADTINYYSGGFHCISIQEPYVGN